VEASVQDALGRFHRALVEEILRTRPLYLSEPFTVSEIYQNLVPYRTHRDRIGVAMNGDYEDVLLRLLAGEGEYLVLESEHARKEIEQELKAQNPNTGLYREYAAVDVRLNPLRMPRDLPDPAAAVARGSTLGIPAPTSLTPSAPSMSQPAAAAPAAPHGAGPTAAGPRPAAPKPPSKAAPVEPIGDDLPLLAARPAPEPASPAPATPSNCLWCREPLPRRDMLNYCPFCGADLHKAPCPNCGEELEVGWRFCVACGTGVDDRA
jgi:hypothetical protein